MPYERDVWGCHLWTGRLDRDGYGRDGSRQAHRVAWEATHGQIPPGLELEHTCRQRRCIRVAHLELVTRGENERRKTWKRRAALKKCKAGHDMSINAIVLPTGGRICRTCTKAPLLYYPMITMG